MQSDIQAILYEAEDHYLQKPDLKDFKSSVASLAQRLETYECLRDREIAIFQPIADELVKAYPEENPKPLENAIKHWLSIMRYCAMAMLLNNPEYLQRQILDWLTEIVKAHQMQSIENTIYVLLLSGLEKALSKKQLALMEPFLEQAQTNLLHEEVPSNQQIPMTVGG